MDKRYDKKILFFDVDDTLVDSKTGKVPESTIEALHNLQENGHKICISTGRPLFNKANPSIFFDVPWDGYVCFNGQGIYNKERVMFYNYAYSKDVVRRLIEKVNEQKYNMMLLEEKRTVMANEYFKYAKTACEYFHIDMPPYEEYKGNDIFGMDMSAPSASDISVFKDIEEIELYHGQNDYLDVVNKGINKKKGIEKMLEYYNMDGYVAFGDSNNDLEMMKGADISICLGQGLETVKKVSTYVTDEVLEDGIYNACKKYKWI